MARFLALGHFDLSSQDLFVVYGDILEGEIRHGMMVELLSGNRRLVEEISGVEFVDQVGSYASSHVALTFRIEESTSAEQWRVALKEDQVLEVYEKAS